MTMLTLYHGSPAGAVERILRSGFSVADVVSLGEERAHAGILFSESIQLWVNRGNPSVFWEDVVIAAEVELSPEEFEQGQPAGNYWLPVDLARRAQNIRRLDPEILNVPNQAKANEEWHERQAEIEELAEDVAERRHLRLVRDQGPVRSRGIHRGQFYGRSSGGDLLLVAFGRDGEPVGHLSLYGLDHEESEIQKATEYLRALLDLVDPR